MLHKNICEKLYAKLILKTYWKNAAQVLDDLTTPPQHNAIFAPPPPESAILSKKIKHSPHALTHNAATL